MNPTSGYPSSYKSDTFSPDRLIAGEDVISRKVTLVTGENRTRGAVLGQITVGAPTSAPFAGNTGNGVLGSLVIGTAKKPGVYKVVVIEPGANVGTFTVEDPDGITVGRGTVAVAFSAAGAPSFTLADGATDFISGDGFDITVAAGSGKYKLSAAAATDGSQVPDVILSEDCDATAADVDCMIYEKGEFNTNSLTLGAGHTVASVREGLRQKGIRLITPAINA